MRTMRGVLKLLDHSITESLHPKITGRAPRPDLSLTPYLLLGRALPIPLVKGGGVGATLEITFRARVLVKLLVGALPEGLLMAKLGLGGAGETIIGIRDLAGLRTGIPLEAILMVKLDMGGAEGVAQGGLLAEMALGAEVADREGGVVAVMGVEGIMVIGIVTIGILAAPATAPAAPAAAL